MSAYGNIALAAFLHCQKWAANPATAWQLAAESECPDSVSMQRKGCPRSAFLGLCSAGLVRGVPKGDYTRSEHNMTYAIKAVELLRADKLLALDRTELWRHVLSGRPKVRHNGQLDVVLALWTQKHLVGS